MYKVSVVCLIAVFMTSTSGCALTGYHQPQMQRIRYYQDCYAPIQHMYDSERTVTGQTILWGFAGGVVGGLGGYAASGDPLTSIATAIGGIAGGAMAGNAMAKRQRLADQKLRMAAHGQNPEGTISPDFIANAAQISLQCYRVHFNELLGDMKAGRISRQDSFARYAEIRSGSGEAARLLGSEEQNGRELQALFERALSEQNLIEEAQIAQKSLSTRHVIPFTEELADTGKTSGRIGKATTGIQRQKQQSRTGLSEQEKERFRYLKRIGG